MKKLLMLTIALMLAAPVLAFSPTLENKDSRRYDIKIECLTTTNTYIGSNTSTTLGGNDGCTLHVKGVGSVKLENNKAYIIKDGKLKVK